MYCESTRSYKRVRTKAVTIGDLVIGDLNPIRIQSMTTTNTEDIPATVKQVLDLEDVGCEIARITAPSIRSAECLEDIANKLRQANSRIPLVADIHFTPNAALKACEFVEKVRVNPGNYADKKKFAVIEYSDVDYQSELNRIEDKFTPLVEKLKQYKRALRIGTNHGSLSDRIMNRYGDSPLGMLESAWEFAQICMKNDFHNFVFSMKSSNPQVMIQAYRLLQKRMYEENAIYPLHLGVTEAGDGDDGRIKSFIGIGSLLDDGLGDTIRVSLTESPIKEIPVAKELADFYNKKSNEAPIQNFNDKRNPYEFKKRETIEVKTLGGEHHPLVILAQQKALSQLSEDELNAYKWVDIKSSLTADNYIFHIRSESDVERFNYLIQSKFFNPEQVILNISEASFIKLIKDKPFAIILPFRSEFLKQTWTSPIIWEIEKNNITSFSASMIGEKDGLSIPNGTVYDYRELSSKADKHPILISSNESTNSDSAYLQEFSILAGSLLCDGIGNALILSSEIQIETQIKSAFSILQASRQRITKTDYISCPSCGRTLFDLEETTAKIKEKTSHLKGVKIAVMGCIVNGPGEMADADFGYVGSGVDKINLYVGKELVKRNIESENAVKELINLIKEHNMWVMDE